MSGSGLRGASVVVTGGSSGIGGAAVRAFAAEGARVHVLDRVAPDGGATAFHEVDVTRSGAVDAAVRAVLAAEGRVDVLVTCAGITRDGVLWKLADDDWASVVAVNLTGTFFCVRAAVPAMRAQGKGAIVLVASINGERGKFGQANYAASKGGVIALGKTAARELGAFGIRVNVVSPGMTETPMTGRLPEASRATALAETALGRIATPDDVAECIVFLGSDRARHVTGQVMRVDGGQYL
jgi:acetoacetyl-CoA reductase/3-oxoacyl-[acyl-carrier protein] reductase